MPTLALFTLIALGLSAAGCSDTAIEEASPVAEPTRTAVQDRAIRSLMLDAGEGQLCDALAGMLVPLPDSAARSGAAAGMNPAVGRLWVERCSAERRGEQLVVGLQGRGWIWSDEQRQGPLGTRFAVNGLLRFRVSAEIAGVVDLGYAEGEHLLSIWLTPRQRPTATMTTLGEVPLRPEGGWSGILGAVGEMLGGSLGEQARPAVAQVGGALIARRLSRGLTATVDLCTGQVDTVLGALENGVTPRRPFPPDGERWVANQRVRLHQGTVDIAGPFGEREQQIQVEVVSEAGPDFAARLVCQEQAVGVIESFVAGRPAPLVTELRQQRVRSGRSVTLELERSRCPVMLITTSPARADEAVELRYRVVVPGATVEPLVECAGGETGSSGGR